MTMNFEWVCPRCGAPHGGHGKGECEDILGSKKACQGLVCDCDDIDDFERPDHGVSFASICYCARCYHCDWEGSLPVKPKGLQPYEKKALEAGWTPPDKRKKELGL